MYGYPTCIRCAKRPTLKSARSCLCWTCARNLGVCIYCGRALVHPKDGANICTYCIPTPHPGCGNTVRGSELADLQYHGSKID